MRVDERFLNPAGTVQGGFLCAMADSAMGAAAVSAAGDRKILVANTEMKVSFLRRVHEGAHLTCTARVLKAGKLITFVVAHITDEHEHLVASASSTYLIKDRTE